MKNRIHADLVLLVLFPILLVIAVLLSWNNILLITLGIPFVLFFPGYGLQAVMFPRQSTISNIDRLVFSLGLSIAVVPLIGLVVNYTPFGLNVLSILYSIGSFTLVMGIIAWIRRNKLPESDRYRIHFSMDVILSGRKKIDYIFSVLLIVTLGVAIFTLVSVLNVSKGGEKFTEFYILGVDGTTNNYPSEVKTGESIQIILGAINREQEKMDYTIAIRIGDDIITNITDISLQADEKWERKISITPLREGAYQKLEFILYKTQKNDPVSELNLWIDVIDNKPNTLKYTPPRK